MLNRFIISAALSLMLVTGCGDGLTTPDGLSFDNPTDSDETSTGTTTTTGTGTGSGSGSGSGSGIVNRATLTKLSHAPKEIPLATGGTQALNLNWDPMISLPNASIFYSGSGSTDRKGKIYKIGTTTDTVATSTHGEAFFAYPTISGDGTIILHEPFELGGISKLNPQTLSDDPIGGLGLLLFTNLATPDDGSLVALVSNGDPTGQNPTGDLTIFKLLTDGSETITQVAGTTRLVATSLAISGDGNVLFFSSKIDVLANGSNPSLKDQIFSINADGTNLRQLTDFTNQVNWVSIKSNFDGSIIAFSRGPDLHVLDTATATVTFTTDLSRNGLTVVANATGLWDMSPDASTLIYNVDNTVRLNNIAGTNEELLYTVSPSLINADFFAKALELAADNRSATLVSRTGHGLTEADENRTQVYRLSW
jgi:hypothetical protein